MSAAAMRGGALALCAALCCGCTSPATAPSQPDEFLGLRTVVYHVAELERAASWYQSVLGRAPYFEESFYVGFDVGGYELGLDPDHSVVAPGAAGAVAYWAVASLEQTFPRLLELGAEAVTGIQEVGGDIRLVVMRDPFGNLLGLIEDPAFAASTR